MTSVDEQVSTPVDNDVYLELQHFYARQMHWLDNGKVAEWATTFTEDGVFDAAGPPVAENRAAIESAAWEVTRKYADEGIQRRHWLGMLHAEARSDGTLVVRSYALIVFSPAGGPTAIKTSCAVEDLLVREDGTLKVRHRRITRDDQP
ncbi:nuclear transport factor 2 family protein [Nocardiopsis mangrovi]|uniref:Nuclear transport factor 2 family protein n=1 Tax=Nocardiopsis mangrovi TaxID=1179818 RepID=A0ABV9DXL3_9ACTN